MPHGRTSLKACNRRLFGKTVANQTNSPLSVEPSTVIADQTGRLLPAVLQRMHPKRRQSGGVVMAEDAEDTAFLMQQVAVEIEIFGILRSGCAVVHHEPFRIMCVPSRIRP